MVSSTENESYALEELPCEDPVHIKDCKEKGYNNISTAEANKKNSFTKLNTFIGILCAFMSAIFGQLISVIVKKILYISVSQLASIRYTGIFLISLPLTIFYTHQILGDRENRRVLLLRGFFAATGLFLQIAAYRHLQLVQASVVMSTLPFVTALLARIILKEPFGVIESISLIITLCGVLLSIGWPEILLSSNHFPFDVRYLLGYAAAIGYVLCIALSYVAVRKLKDTHYSIILLYTGFIGTIETVILNASMFSFVAADCGWDQVLCPLLALFGFVANWMLTVAVQNEPAGLVAVQKSCFDVLVITAFQVIFFRTYPDWYAIAGVCLVLTSLTIIGIKKSVQMMPGAN